MEVWTTYNDDLWKTDRELYTREQLIMRNRRAVNLGLFRLARDYILALQGGPKEDIWEYPKVPYFGRIARRFCKAEKVEVK